MIAQLDRDFIKRKPSRAMARVVSHLLLQGRPLTTKGRWLNHLLFLQYSLVKNLPQLRSVHKPIFILGLGRSGTTILGKIFSLHFQICFLNEPKALWHSIYAGEDLIGSYTDKDADYVLTESHVNQEVIKAANKLYAYSLFITRSERVLDKYPELIFRLPFVKSIFPDAKFIFLVRDGWDTISSISKWSKSSGLSVDGEVHDWWGRNYRKWNMLIRDVASKQSIWEGDPKELLRLSNQTDMAAVEWVVTMRKGLELVGKFPESVCQIYYEDLVNSPEKSLGKLLDFCDLPRDEVMLNYGRNHLSSRPHKASFEMSPLVKPAFLSTMAEFGYNKR